MINDTIVALSTPPIMGAIALVRMSGSKSFDIINKIFDKKIELNNKKKDIYYGKIIDNGNIIDEVVLFAYKGPFSYTGEDTIEISCHGNIMIANEIINLCISRGAVQADHGEFTKQAFYNGKLDLLQSEAVNDLITSKSKTSKEAALNVLNGKLSEKINQFKQELLDLLSQIEVNIDYPEYEDIVQLTNEQIKPAIIKLKNKLDIELKNGYIGKTIKNGVNVAIVGKPNSGKSSLLNSLLGENKAIVTDIEGTTRDVVEGQIIYNGILFNLFDTAGLRETSNLIEKIGIEKSYEAINKANIVLLVVDSNQTIGQIKSDIERNFIDGKNVIIVLNKTDISNTQLDEFNGDNICKISAKTSKFDNLMEKIVKFAGLSNYSSNISYLSNDRHFALVEKAIVHLDGALKTILEGMPIDIVSIELKESLNAINDILGANSKLDLANNIFAKFCIGK
mgnify:CR=1 FL=1